MFATGLEVRCHIVEFPEQGGKSDVTIIVEPCRSEDENSILLIAGISVLLK